jgi:hypothetical protein
MAGVAFMFAISYNYNPTPISIVAFLVTYVSLNVALAANKKPKE